MILIASNNSSCNVKGRPCGSVAQLAECSHGKQETLGSSPSRATFFFHPSDSGIVSPISHEHNFLSVDISVPISM